MKSRKYTWLIALAVIALVGSVAVQASWVYLSYRQSEVQLQQQLGGALVNAVDQLNTSETLAFIAKVSTDDHQADDIREAVRVVQTTDIQIESFGDHKVRFDSIQKMLHKVSDSVNQDGRRPAMVSVGYRSENGNEDVTTTIEWKTDSVVDHVLELNKEGKLKDVVERIERESLLGSKNWKDRLDSAKLQAAIQSELKDFGYEGAFEFAVVNEVSEPFDGFKSGGFDRTMSSVSATTELFSDDLQAKDLRLLAYIPGAFSHVVSNIWLTLLASLIFTVLMIVVFMVTIQKLLSQSKLNQLKSDFINNMGHELKTPLATISLAADALQHPTSKASRELSDSFIQTIKREHARMNDHIERVLQMAQSEREGFDLNLEQLDLNELLTEVCARFQMLSKDTGANVRFEASGEVQIAADKLHLSSALSNLIDNGIKYNDRVPDVNISIRDVGDELEIKVQDNGIGIDVDQQQSVFDRFYRVQSGNLHSVKGFGLGLSYVKMVIEAHRGSIHLQSKPTVGTTFIIKLPKG